MGTFRIYRTSDTSFQQGFNNRRRIQTFLSSGSNSCYIGNEYYSCWVCSIRLYHDVERKLFKCCECGAETTEEDMLTRSINHTNKLRDLTAAATTVAKNNNNNSKPSTGLVSSPKPNSGMHSNTSGSGSFLCQMGRSKYSRDPETLRKRWRKQRVEAADSGDLEDLLPKGAVVIRDYELPM
jgi:hypothetical protein